MSCPVLSNLLLYIQIPLKDEKNISSPKFVLEGTIKKKLEQDKYHHNVFGNFIRNLKN